MDTERCNENIYKNGEHVQVSTMHKDEANRFCEWAQKHGVEVDWHYAGGRVTFKTISDVTVARAMLRYWSSI